MNLTPSAAESTDDLPQIRIVLADDHAVVRAGLRGLLEQFPELHVIGEVDNGADLPPKVQELKPHVALVDVSMPGLNGFEAVEQAIALGTDTQFLFLSMHEEPEYVVRGVKSGASGYLFKRAEPDEVRSAIHTVAAGGRYVSLQVAEAVFNSFRDQPQADETREKLDILLSDREREVLQAVADGLRTKEIADQLFLSPRTVETHRVNVMKKLKASNTAELIKLAVLYNIVKV
jgi:DNA-binding NarL/FixJ family response regulator